MFKRVLIFVLLNLMCLGMVFAQQITRMAVVDLPRVYTTFFRESTAVRQFEERSARVQSDINRMTNDIQTLRTRQADAIARDDQSESIRLETEINRRTEDLRNFYNARTAELERQRNQLMQSNTFLNQVHDEIRFIAESEGYSVVFDIKNTPGIVWNSPTIDITERLIASLQTRARN